MDGILAGNGAEAGEAEAGSEGRVSELRSRLFVLPCLVAVVDTGVLSCSGEPV